MQKIINVLAVLSFVGVSGIIGGGAAVYLNREAITENVKEKVLRQQQKLFSGALPGMLESSMPELPSATGPVLPNVGL